jgi:N-acyl-D-amino-acid deacylase
MYKIKIVISLFFFFHFQSLSAQLLDILIKNGKIIDGTGNSWYYADIAIKDGRIFLIKKNITLDALKVIDAKGLIVAPGFIDVHTHIEDDEAKNPYATNFIYDGVTTVITGNCGSSRPNLQTYFKYLDSLRLSINVAALIGHNDVRKSVMGKAMRDPTEKELQQMEALVHKAMQDGAVGLSTGLIYIPGTYSKTEEIIRLAKVAAQYNGVYASHMRNEGDSVTQAIEEAINIGRVCHMPVQISHFKLSGQNNWGRSKYTLQQVIDARKEGLDVTIDQYPYTASSTSLSTLIPDWVLADGQDSIKARLQNSLLQKVIRQEMEAKLKKRKQKHYHYAVVAFHKADTSYNGKSIYEINILKGRKATLQNEITTIFDLMINGGASCVFHGMSEEDVQYIMGYPYNMFASDASIREWNVGMPHPRGYGTNARVLGNYVRTLNVLSLEEAIRRMTSLPAQKFNLKNRGLLKENFVADIVVFNEDEVMDASTFSNPHQYSKGMYYVLVNGIITLANKQHTRVRVGEVLKNEF